jgi:tetratricopeptide (TPR) repeat protein
MTLAKAYYKLLRYDDAIAHWQKALELDPSNARAKKNIALARSKLGR